MEEIKTNDEVVVTSNIVVGKVTSNIEKIIEDLPALIEPFENYVMQSEEDLATARSFRANLNNISKLINNEKIKVKKKYLKPYNEFEKKVKEAIAMIDKASNNIDEQVKLVEEEQKLAKEQELLDFFLHLDCDYVDFKQIFDPKWLNKTTSMKKAQEELEGKVQKIINDFATIDTMNVDTAQFKIEYLNNGFDISKARERYEKHVAMQETLKQKTENTVQPKLSVDLKELADAFEFIEEMVLANEYSPEVFEYIQNMIANEKKKVGIK